MRGYPQVELVQSDDWFRATVVAMGTMGFITSVIIEVTTPFSLLAEDWKGHLGRVQGDPPRHRRERISTLFRPARTTERVVQPLRGAALRAGPTDDHDEPELRPRRAPFPGSIRRRRAPLPAAGLAGRIVGNDLPALTPLLIDLALGGDPTTPTWGPAGR